MPASQREEFGVGGILGDYGEKNIKFSYNHAVGGYNHNYYGRDDLYKYYSDKPNHTRSTGMNSYFMEYKTGTNIINFATSRGVYDLKKTDSVEVDTRRVSGVSDPQIDKITDSIPVKYDLAIKTYGIGNNILKLTNLLVHGILPITKSMTIPNLNQHWINQIPHMISTNFHMIWHLC